MTALRQEHQIFNRLGSFWTSSLSPDATGKARALAETSEVNAGVQTLQRAVRRLTSAGKQRLQYWNLKVLPTAITQIQESPTPKWRMPLAEPIEPLAIHTRRGLRVQGTDFSYEDGAVLWNESPHDLLHLPEVLVLSYREAPPSLWNYTLRLDGVSEAPTEVMRYYRVSQDPKQFERAIAVAAGYTVLPFTSKLVQVLNGRYTFEAGVVVADYEHQELPVGNVYPAGTVIGDMVKVTAAPAGSSDWYRKFDWTQGMSLDALSPFRGLVVPDGQRRVETTTESTAHPGHYHVTAPLELAKQSGSVSIGSGVSSKYIPFVQRFPEPPIVTGSPVAGTGGELSAVSAVIYDVTDSGFYVVFSGTSSQPFSFHWIAEPGTNYRRTTTVPAGTSSLRINYPVVQSQVPVIAGILETDSTGDIEILPHIVSLPDNTGFDLLFAYPPSRDLKFNWTYQVPSGLAKRELIPEGATQLTVVFDEPFELAPLLLHGLQNADPDASEIIPYVITNLSHTGFTVLLSGPAASDAYFHWQSGINYLNIRERFWAHQAAMEDITGVFLADVLGLTAPGFVSANLIDIFFQYLLGNRGLIVELKQSNDNDAHVERAQRFMLREKPLSSTLIVRNT